MARIERKVLLEKFRGMIAKRQPIIGGGAGTGLSAKCEEAGGIDLIVIYNSGRYRMAGRGSWAGLLAYGNANDIAGDGAGGSACREAYAGACGVNGTIPLRSWIICLTISKLGFSGCRIFRR
jgi:predicted TIM-barrel enzyme